MEFVKMHGLGNDFILVNGFKEDVSKIIKKSKMLCDRHLGIGADGVILALPSDKADVKMRVINSDGSEAPMCGNGIRCFARYVFTRGIVSKTKMSVETLAGIMKPEIIIIDDVIEAVKVDMGHYSLLKKDVPIMGSPDEEALDLEVEAQDQKYIATGVSMGNPHCVIFVDNVDGVPLEKVGPILENHPLFPKKTNVEFIEVKGKDHLKMRVWERGCGLTLACGTGACASAVAAYKKGIAGNKVKVSLSVGDLMIEIQDDRRVFMTGPAEEVYSGDIVNFGT
ncbi:MAG: diaminopimelate epimerase [Thermoanaerobacteraceae bacterium]|jgi:diaminopimelate epimerase|nr:diaminopimelate epimerase [Thermoanaerobacteraceae bacterium]MDN5311331.1 diaminopimelate epimerase [Thermoanaerobacteraceae bacterium]